MKNITLRNLVHRFAKSTKLGIMHRRVLQRQLTFDSDHQRDKAILSSFSRGLAEFRRWSREQPQEETNERAGH